MQFHSLSQFFAMGGYAFYVWMAYGMFLLVTVWLVAASYHRRRQLIARESRRQRRERALSDQADQALTGAGSSS